MIIYPNNQIFSLETHYVRRGERRNITIGTLNRICGLPFTRFWVVNCRRYFSLLPESRSLSNCSGYRGESADGVSFLTHTSFTCSTSTSSITRLVLDWISEDFPLSRSRRKLRVRSLAILRQTVRTLSWEREWTVGN